MAAISGGYIFDHNSAENQRPWVLENDNGFDEKLCFFLNFMSFFDHREIKTKGKPYIVGFGACPPPLDQNV